MSNETTGPRGDTQAWWAETQMAKEQAIAFHDARAWENLSSRQIVDIQLFQKLLCVPFDVFHKALEEQLGRPVYTHELGLNYGGLVREYQGASEAPTLEAIFSLIPEDKRVIIQTDS